MSQRALALRPSVRLAAQRCGPKACENVHSIVIITIMVTMTTTTTVKLIMMGIALMLARRACGLGLSLQSTWPSACGCARWVRACCACARSGGAPTKPPHSVLLIRLEARWPSLRQRLRRGCLLRGAASVMRPHKAMVRAPTEQRKDVSRLAAAVARCAHGTRGSHYSAHSRRSSARRGGRRLGRCGARGHAPSRPHASCGGVQRSPVRSLRVRRMARSGLLSEGREGPDPGY
jgi:hypothetical protein